MRSLLTKKQISSFDGRIILFIERDYFVCVNRQQSIKVCKYIVCTICMSRRCNKNGTKRSLLKVFQIFRTWFRVR